MTLKGKINFLSLLFLAFFTFAQGAHAQFEPELSFAGVRDNYPQVGQPTYYYVAKSGTQPASSYLSLALCGCGYSVVDAGNWGVNFEDLIPRDDSYIYYGTDPLTGVTGIRYAIDASDGEIVKFYFTIDTILPRSEIQFAIKSGLDLAFGTVTGPLCDCNPQATPEPTIIHPTPVPPTPVYPTPEPTVEPTPTSDRNY